MLSSTYPVAAAPTASLQGVLNLLTEDNQAIVSNALKVINDQLPLLYYEVAMHIPALESLAMSPSTTLLQEMASLILAKLYFYLQQPEQAVDFALKSGALFQIGMDDSLFGQTMTSGLIDRYLLTHDATIEPLVDSLVAQALHQQDPESALALALEARRSDLTADILTNGTPELLSFALELLQNVETSEFKTLILGQICQWQLQLAPIDLKVLMECYPEHKELIMNSSQVSLEQKQQLLLFFERSDVIRHVRLLFSSHRNHSDLLILERSKALLNSSASLHHKALTFANALMQCGTTCDELIRSDLPWFGMATNWAKFSGVASLGVIHQGQRDPMKLLDSFLPKESISTSEYSEGGSLFALGLVGRYQNPLPANLEGKEDDSVEALLIKHLSHSSEVVQHGACLGLGLWLLGQGTTEHMEAVKTVLYADSAVSGEAAALALGLLGYGRYDEFSSLLEEVAEYARETQHEKISRALSVAIALFYAESAHCDQFIMSLLDDESDALRRYGGALALAAAFVNTGSQQALDPLLQLTVTDTSDDVRRVAVAGLGLVLGEGKREQLLDILPLLLQSFNPHVRYGAALALGLTFAGSGNEQVVNLLKPLSRDLIDFVRQASLMSLSLVMQQQPESISKELRKALEYTVHNKYEDPLVKFGAIIGQGLLDAGGRNSVFTLRFAKRIQGAFIGVCSETFDVYPSIQGLLRCKPGECAYPLPLKRFEAATAQKPMASAVLSASKRRKPTSDQEDIKKEGGGDDENNKKKIQEESSMQVDEPTEVMVNNFERVPLWLADRFSYGSNDDKFFDPFGVQWIAERQEDLQHPMLVFETLTDEPKRDFTALKSPTSMNVTPALLTKAPPKSFKFNPTQ